MVGMPFLSDSVISLKENKIQSQLGNFPIYNTKKGVTLKLKARTHHRPLIWLLNLKDPTVGSRLARWKIKLQEYDYEVVYKQGRVNVNADALSRNPIDNSSSKQVDLTKTDELNLYNDTFIHEYSVESFPKFE